MSKQGFSLIGLIISITAVVLIGLYINKNYNLSLNFSKKEVQEKAVSNNTKVTETETIPTTNLQNLTCGFLGFKDKDSINYTLFGSIRFKKFGKDFNENISPENSAKINKALLTIMPQTPPEYNPPIDVCFTAGEKIMLVVDKQTTLFYLDNQYNLQKTIPLNNFTPIYDFLAYTQDKILYIQQSSKDFTSGKMTDAVLKVNINDGTQKLLNYSERVETVGVPQKNDKTQSSTMTSKNLKITFTAPEGIAPTYSPLFDQAIEYFYFRKGADELEVSLSKDNPYCKEQTGSYNADKIKVNIAGKWTISKIRTSDPRGKQVVWQAEVLADENVCISIKETLNEDRDMETVFDNILTTAKIN